MQRILAIYAILLGLLEDKQRLLKASCEVLDSLSKLNARYKQNILDLHKMKLLLFDLEISREDPDSVLLMNGLEMSIEEKLIEIMEEVEEQLSENDTLSLELCKERDKLLKVRLDLDCLIKALSEMLNGVDVAVGVKMIGSIDLIALQEECVTNFMKNKILQELIKARKKERCTEIG